MTWNEYDTTITITDGNAFALAMELSKLDSEYGPCDYIPFIRERIGHEYEVRTLFDEAFHWGIYRRVEEKMKRELEDDTLQLTVDEYGDFEFLRLPKDEYLEAAETRRIGDDTFNEKQAAEKKGVATKKTKKKPAAKKKVVKKAAKTK